jgi:hypothetical protein
MDSPHKKMDLTFPLPPTGTNSSASDDEVMHPATIADADTDAMAYSNSKPPPRKLWILLVPALALMIAVAEGLCVSLARNGASSSSNRNDENSLLEAAQQQDAANNRSLQRERLLSGSRFRIKMHWERSYFWQEEDAERRWCLECTTCAKLTKSGSGQGCQDENNNDGTDCKDFDQLWIQNCNGWENSRGNTDFEIVRGSGADQIKIRNKNLCMERATNIFVHLRPCDANEVKQLWVGFRTDRPFDLRPLQQNLRPSQYNKPAAVQRCISQDHHPKKYEIIFLEECEKAYFWDTALWEAI